MNRDEKKKVYEFNEQSEYVGARMLDWTDRSPSGAWQIPWGCTEDIPPAEKEGHKIIRKEGKWEYEQLPVPKPPPAPKELTEEELKLQAALKLKKEHDAAKEKILERFNIANLNGDTALAASLQAKNKKLEADYEVKRGAL